MSSKTKIIVLRMKEIIYTAIFVGLGILLILLLLVMFRPGKESTPASAKAQYIPGIYTSSITLGTQEINVEVSVDADRITSITMTPLSDAVETMYPLVEPAMNELVSQIVQNQSTDNISYANTSQYTSKVLLNAIDNTLSKAKKSDSSNTEENAKTVSESQKEPGDSSKTENTSQ